jgi:hypothetical protein
MLEPLEDLETVHARHFEIKEKEPGRLCKVLKFVHGLLPVASEGE